MADKDDMINKGQDEQKVRGYYGSKGPERAP